MIKNFNNLPLKRIKIHFYIVKKNEEYLADAEKIYSELSKDDWALPMLYVFHEDLMTSN